MDRQNKKIELKAYAYPFLPSFYSDWKQYVICAVSGAPGLYNYNNLFLPVLIFKIEKNNNN